MSNTQFPPESFRPLLAKIATHLKERKESISVAETSTGGLISAALLSVPGASAYYKGGLTVYTLESRKAFAGWTDETVKDYRGPTPAIVSGLAESAREKLESTYTISESGVAGPTGGRSGFRNQKPGYTALAIASASGTKTKEIDTNVADRERNMILFTEEALKFLAETLELDSDRSNL
ncbi:competence/damage-inducible protein-like protein cinA [Schizopora paradoxa]|uniref:Competence/damage-inducible protein-like protein cinA n=1 Tax=Schizopora paradoxa TaxID=27342 RepID=A0A0H2S4D2_9AGAM|nr:competence/damage-inducible protein-like protein cinA [Schizopora paradoxa]